MNTNEQFLTPNQLAKRWHWHPESIRRKIRRREIASKIIGRRRLIALEEAMRIESEGSIQAC
jgi:hypothetical protein